MHYNLLKRKRLTTRHRKSSFSRQIFNAEAGIRYQAGPNSIIGRKSDTKTDFPSSTSFPFVIIIPLIFHDHISVIYHCHDLFLSVASFFK
jgi:hypothetical protein